MVVVVKPGQDSDVPADMKVPVSIHAADDYGLTSAALHYTHEGGKPGSVKIQGTANRPRELTATHVWDLSAVKLLPGDIVSYYVEVQDNDTVSGPKKARSRTYTLRIPTLTDLYAEVGEEHKSAAASLEEVREEGLELKQELDRIARELTKFPDAAWEDRQEVAQAFERQEAIRRAGGTAGRRSRAGALTAREPESRRRGGPRQGVGDPAHAGPDRRSGAQGSLQAAE